MPIQRFFKVFSILLILLVTEIQAISVKDAYKSLGEYDYFRAKKGFYQNLKKKKCATAYGLATIYYRKDNPFHNPDSAWKYSSISLQHYDKKNSDSVFGKFVINTQTLQILKSKIEHLVIQTFRDSALKMGERELNQFISFYAASNIGRMAMAYRDSLFLSRIDGNDKIAHYRKFLKLFPESIFTDEALHRLDEALFQHVLIREDPALLYRFVRQYPKSHFVKQAITEIFTLLVEQRDVRGLRAFIDSFPKSDLVRDAWIKIYLFSVPKNTPEYMADFVEKYPEFPLRNEIEQMISLSYIRLIAVENKKGFGFIDTLGIMYIDFQYDEVGEFREGLCPVSINERYGYVDKTNKLLIPFIYDEAESFDNGFAFVKKGNNGFLIDRVGKEVLSDIDDFFGFNEGFAVVKRKDKYGIINARAQWIHKPDFEQLSDFSEGYSVLKKNGRYGYIDTTANLIIANTFDWAGSFRNGRAIIKTGKKFGVINRRGEIILKPDYDRIEISPGGNFLLINGSNYGFADSSGCIVANVNSLYSPSLKPEDLCNGKQFRLIGEDQEKIIGINGENLFGYHEEIYFADGAGYIYKNDGKYGMLGTRGNVLIKPQYKEFSFLTKNRFLVRKKNTQLIIDTENHIIATLPNTEVELLPDGLIMADVNGKQVLYNENGNEMLTGKLEEFEWLDKRLFKLKRDGNFLIYSVADRKILFAAK